MTNIMVADRIKNLREQANFTQAALARKLGVTRSSVNAWEDGCHSFQYKCVGDGCLSSEHPLPQGACFHFQRLRGLPAWAG